VPQRRSFSLNLSLEGCRILAGQQRDANEVLRMRN
jgi:hypothetical protein